MKKRLYSVFVLVMALGILLSGCGSNNADAATPAEGGDKSKVIIGVRSDGIDMVGSVEETIKGLGFELEIVVFDDSVQPNIALTEGSIDMNWYQHKPYLDAYNGENGTDLVMIDPKTHYPLFAMYSEKHETIDDLPDGAVIGLCNDATNQARGMQLLADKGLITLDDSVEIPTRFDVVDNPHNFEFIEAEMSILPQSLGDTDAICLAAMHMMNAGKSASDYVTASEDSADYALGLVVRAEDADAEWALTIAREIQCDALGEYYESTGGVLIPSWT